MNLLLLEEGDLLGPARARVTAKERLEHLRRILRAQPGDEIVVGRLGGAIGTGRITRLDDEAAELALELDQEPPAGLRITLVLALPRPPMLRRLLQAVTSMGVKRIVLLHTARVEKSFWQSSLLAPDALHRQLVLGLEQGRDTVLPELLLRRRFLPFVEDELPVWLETSRGLLAHPGAGTPVPRSPTDEVTLLIGPEGGFVPFELERLERAGTTPVGLGPRPLRTETAVIALLARLTA